MFPHLKIFNFTKVDPNRKTKRGLKKIKYIMPKEEQKQSIAKVPFKKTGIVKVKHSNKTNMLSNSTKDKVSKILHSQPHIKKWEN